jgi:hypothetical protein
MFSCFTQIKCFKKKYRNEIWINTEKNKRVLDIKQDFLYY